MSSQEFHVHSWHGDLSPSLLLPKRLKWRGSQSPVASLEPKEEACSKGKARTHRQKGLQAGSQVTDCLERMSELEGRCNPRAKAQDPGSKMALGTLEPLH